MRDAGVWSRPAFLGAVVLLLAQGLWLAATAPCWHEEVSAQVERAPRIATADGAGEISLAPSCADADAPWLVRSPVRPVLAICLGGLALPVMINAYSSGLPQWPFALLWPLHQGDPFRLRMLGVLCLGLWALFLAHRLAARAVDELTGDLSVLVLAASSQFTSTYSLLVQYEVFPALFLGTAALLWLRARERTPETGGAAALPVVGLLVGLALLSNLKTLLVLVPILAVVARRRDLLAPVGRGAWGRAAAGAAIALSPFLIASLTDPSGGVSMQASTRLATLLSHLQLARFVRELGNVLVYWSDLRYYADLIVGREPQINWPGAVVAAAALGYGTAQLVRFLRRGEGDWLLPIATAQLLFFVAVSVLLYDQQPAANYAPVHLCFGWVTGLALRRALQALGERRTAAIALAVGGIAAFGWASAVRLPMPSGMPMSINAVAERALVERLQASPREGTVVTTIYNHVGVLDAMGLADRGPVAVHTVFDPCRHDAEEGAAAPCVAERWSWVLRDEARLPLHVVVPVGRSVIDEPWASELEPALRHAAADRGLRVEEDGAFAGSSGPAVIRLLSVRR